MTAAPMTSAGLRSPRGPLGILFNLSRRAGNRRTALTLRERTREYVAFFTLLHLKQPYPKSWPHGTVIHCHIKVTPEPYQKVPDFRQCRRWPTTDAVTFQVAAANDSAVGLARRNLRAPYIRGETSRREVHGVGARLSASHVGEGVCRSSLRARYSSLTHRLGAPAPCADDRCQRLALSALRNLATLPSCRLDKAKDFLLYTVA